MSGDFLQCWGDSLSGKVGFSFTSRSVDGVAQAIFKYCNTHFIDKVCIARDNRPFADQFTERMIESLSVMGVATVVIDRPSPIFLLSWLATQSNEGTKTLGVYIGGDQAPYDYLSISFRNSDGSPFKENQTREIYDDYNHSMKFHWEFRDRPRDAEYIDLTEGYTQWLLDNLKFSKEVSNSSIEVDYLTSPAQPFFLPLSSALGINVSTIPEEIWHTAMVTKRLRPCPRGWPLIYPYNFHRKLSDSSADYRFSFDGDADCIGVFDNTTGEDLSPSALFVILLYYFSKVKKRKGTVLLARAVSEKVQVVAEHYGLAVEYVDEGLFGLGEKIKEKRKRPALMYGDEEGGFWFKGLPLDRNPFPALIYIIEACEFSGLSPAKLYDSIVEGILDRTYAYGKIDIPLVTIDRNNLDNLTLNEKSVGKRTIVERISEGKYTSLKFDDNSRVVLQSNLKNDFVELHVESDDTEKMHEVIGDIQRLIYNSSLTVL